MNKIKAFNKFLKYSGILKILRNFSSNQTLRILMYHRVFDKGNNFSYYLEGTPPDDFNSQMDLLSKHFSVIALEDAVKRIESGKSLPKKAVSITIDDGYKDCYEYIYPILRKYSLPATIFLTVNNIESSDVFWADKIGYFFKKGKPVNKFYKHDLLSTIEVDSFKNRMLGMEYTVQKLKTLPQLWKNEVIGDLQKFFQIKDYELQADYNLSWDQIKEMSNNGIYFGAHTVTHPILTRIPIEKAEIEIKESKEIIENKISKSVTGFCYPNGTEVDFNDSIIEILKKYNFKYAVTTVWGFNNINSDLFKLNRVGPNADDDLYRFECIVSGGFEIKTRLRKIFRVKR